MNIGMKELVYSIASIVRHFLCLHGKSNFKFSGAVCSLLSQIRVPLLVVEVLLIP